MNVDEDQKFVLTRYGKEKGKSVVVKSDHNILYLTVKCLWNTKSPQDRSEQFNLKNKTCQEAFKKDTDETNISTNSFSNRSVVSGGKLWLENLNSLIHKNFKKVRNTGKAKINKIQ